MKHLGPDEIDRIDELGRAVVAGDTDDDLFGPLVHEIAAALDVSECSIYTYQPIDQTVRAVAIWRRDPAVSEAAPGVVQSLRSRWDFAAVLAQNTTAETRADGEALLPSDRQRMAAAGELAALTAPLAVGDEVVGLIHAVERRRPRRFTAAERALFDAFGEAAAMAIHADALNRRLEVQNAQLELRLRERDRLTDELKDLSLRDEMTGLLNRRGFFTVAAQQFKLARRIGHRCMVAFVDVDGMKKLNDTWGHSAGDQAIKVAGGLLRETFREADVVARIGGDEFVVFMVEGRDAPAQVAAERLERAVGEWRRESTAPWAAIFDLSFGSAACERRDRSELDELLERADAEMYLHKRRRQAVRRRAG